MFFRRMTLEEFMSLATPEKLGPALQALWYDARGDWNRAHEIAQGAAGKAGDRVHAYLHRKEGDDGNARYWYTRTNRVKPNQSLDEEWRELVREFLKN